MALTKLSTDVIDLSTNTGALTIPSGTTSDLVSVEYLIVAGGGGSNNYNSGGGGAGGLLTATISASTINITIGEGGALSNNTEPPPSTSNGDDSTLSGSNITLVTVTGGGKAGQRSGVAGSGGGDGGSGGGGGSLSYGGNVAGSGNTPSTTPSQGFDGGVGQDGGNYRGGGGGGAGAVGASSASSGNGGIGLDMSSIINATNAGYASVGEVSGSAVYFAGGGGAGANSNPGLGALGGGGNGGTSSQASQGTEGTGGGAGGGSYPTTLNAAKGGRGVVVLRYKNASAVTSGFTAEAGPYTEGDYKVLVLKQGSGTVVFTFTGPVTGRPASPTEGLMRENTTTGKMEFYDGSLWQEITDTASSYSPGFIASANFNTVLYPGTNQTPTVITGVGFKPDFTWIKVRNNAWPHGLFSSLMPVYAYTGGYEFMYSNTNQVSEARWGSLQFDDDGWSGLGGSYNGTFAHDFGASGYNYVSWNWKAGGTAVLNENGTIDSQVSANIAAGFSIVNYTTQSSGTATVGHGLSSPPDMIIVKTTGVADSWRIYNSSLGADKQIFLNETTAASIRAEQWNNTSPTNSVFSLGTDNAGSYTTIAYCWHSVPGYSKIGFYVGNGSTTGPEIYTGFKPAWLMTKPATTSGYWYVLDNKRNTSNPRNTGLFPNDDIPESTDTNYNVDFNNTGFQPKNNTIGFNNLGVTYIYMTFAE